MNTAGLRTDAQSLGLPDLSHWFFVKENPLTPSGKIQIHVLKDMIETETCRRSVENCTINQGKKGREKK